MDGFDALQDFKPLTSFLTFDFCLMVHESIPGRTLAGLIAHILASPGKVSHGNASITSDLVAPQLAAGFGQQIVDVPYEGEAQCRLT